MLTIELYVPLTDNQGQEIDRDHWDGLRERIIVWFDGFTVFRAEGRWKDQTERIAVFRILSKEDQEASKAIAHKLAAYVKEHWHQTSVLWTLTEIGEIYFT